MHNVVVARTSVFVGGRSGRYDAQKWLWYTFRLRLGYDSSI